MDSTLIPILLLAVPSVISPLHLHAALNGRPGYMHSLLLCLGMQMPLSPAVLNEAEYPAVAAMTTGYVFRVENQATAMFLQRVGRTGHLVTLNVSDHQGTSAWALLAFIPLLPVVFGIFVSGLGFVLLIIGFLVFPVSMLSSVTFCIPLLLLGYGLMLKPVDQFLLITVLLLLLSRVLAIISLRAKTLPSWHGASEPDVTGDLLILLSQDRWIRMKGLVDDLKAVTSGSWLRTPKYPGLMEALEWTARMLVYVSAITLANAKEGSKIVLVIAVLVSHGLLALSNAGRKELIINERKIKISEQEGGIKKYERRLELAKELVEETGRSDWAVRLGMINPEQAKSTKAGAGGETKDAGEEVVTM